MKPRATGSLVVTTLLALTPLIAQIPNSLATSVSLPEGWELVDLGGACAARLSGDKVDTMLSTNNKDQVLLVAGRHDWNFPAGNIRLTLMMVPSVGEQDAADIQKQAGDCSHRETES